MARSFRIHGAALKVLGAIALGAPFGLAAPAQPAAGYQARGTIVFSHKTCSKAKRTTRVPLQNAFVHFRNKHGKEVGAATTNAHGVFSDEIDHRYGPVTASLKLKLPAFSVSPPGSSKPYRFRYPGEFTSSRPALPTAVYKLRFGPAAGAMNIFNTLQDGVRAAAGLGPGPVNATWGPRVDYLSTKDLGKSGSYYEIGPRRIRIDGNGAVPGDEWEPWVILHEYGHHVLHSLNAEGGESGGEHELHLAYPDRPALAWSEGFADAFGVIATDLADGPDPVPAGQAPWLCRTPIDLASTRPKPTPPANSPQYNETAAASVIWALSKRLSGGAADEPVLLASGLRKLVRIAKGHYRPPEDMEDVRDSLTSVSGVEETPADHDAIDKIFARRGHMAWGKSFTLIPTSVSGGAPQLHLRFTGPSGYGTCEVADQFDTYLLQGTGDGPFPGVTNYGGLGYTWQDDCLNFSDDDTPNGPPEAPTGGTTFGELILSHPFLANGGHRQGSYELYATWLCQDIPAAPPDFPGSPCDSSAEYEVIACSPAGSFGPGDPCSGNVAGGNATATLDAATEKKVADFTADGRQCRLYGDTGTQSCSTGLAW